jgi:phosphotransferase system enzyme I (PtsI)
VKAGIESRRENAEWVAKSTAQALERMLAGAKDEALRERAVDISDVAGQIINKLLNVKHSFLAALDEDVILVARELLPSEAMMMDKTHVKGMAMDAGSPTSHIAILARSFEIPAVMGLSTISASIKTGETMIIDGDTGDVVLQPKPESIEKFRSLYVKRQQLLLRSESVSAPAQCAETKDGCRIRLQANIEGPHDIERVLRYGAEGVGLYRSEFLYLSTGKSAGEEEQYEAYSRVIKALGGLPVTIRTYDVGGDKVVAGFYSGKNDEKNPLLGCRAIRASFASPALFKDQLRAILRAAVWGNARLLLPMISCVEELEQALGLLDEAKAECRKKGQPIDEELETGVMIEVPSAALTVDILSQKARFFSIGTNDLQQYTFAVDRGNEKVSHLATPYQPAFLRLIKAVIDGATANKVKVAMCGEVAGVPALVPLLIGLGLEDLSMSASLIPGVKAAILATRRSDCQTLAAAALACTRAQEVRGVLEG